MASIKPWTLLLCIGIIAVIVVAVIVVARNRNR
jgi:hypothetical protein